MKEFDPYKVLKVRKNATAAQIEKAFRKRCMETHTDRGGDAEEFAKVQRAAAVLRDPERRRKYDETGVIDEDPVPNNEESEAFQIIMETFDSVLNQALMSEYDLTEVDIIHSMALKIEGRNTSAKEKQRRAKHVIKSLGKTKGRFSSKNGKHDHFEAVIANNIAHAELLLKQAEDEEKIVLNAQEILSGIKYKTENQEPEEGDMKPFKRAAIVWDSSRLVDQLVGQMFGGEP